MRLNQVTAPATDLAASISFYEALGLKLIVRADHYARFRTTGGILHIFVARGAQGGARERPIVYFECDDLDERVARLKSASVAFEDGSVDQSWLWREAHLRDPARQCDLPLPRPRQPNASAVAIAQRRLMALRSNPRTATS